MSSIDTAALNQLFLTARTANGFVNKPVSVELLKQVNDLAKFGATSMNTQPVRSV